MSKSKQDEFVATVMDRWDNHWKSLDGDVEIKGTVVKHKDLMFDLCILPKADPPKYSIGILQDFGTGQYTNYVYNPEIVPLIINKMLTKIESNGK